MNTNNRFTLAMALRSMGDLRDVIRDTHGNLSCRHGDTVWIKPSGVPYESIEPAVICELSIDGTQRQATPRPSVDTPHHLSIYRQNPHVGAICHTHSPYATAFAWAERVIPCYGTEHADFFGPGYVRCLEYRDLNSWGVGVSVSPGEGAVLLGRHGALTFADGPHKAVALAVALENIAQKAFLYGQLVGDGACPLPRVEAKKWYDRYNGGGYGQ